MLLMNASTSSFSTKTSRGDTPFSSTYDKQVAWKHHQQRKTIEKIQAKLSEEERFCTFSPKTNHQRSNEQQCNKASVQADKASKQGGMPKNLRTLSDISMAAIESEGLDCTDKNRLGTLLAKH
uniref:AlNc14C34G3054 protein n=1 Tax=Albugo laibachii Nc14 TaxID=890382 RepID=F0W8C3_9STRA|nr:AlNc14C34G3054 [Albugo laibachii Nc14]|eukprot:CCA17378.1 AlNc14C34G3054 [Albugo laibachii Nc14]